MNRLITFFYFLFFFFGFFISEIFRFYYGVYQQNNSVFLQVLLLAIASVSGVFLLVSFRRLKLLSLQWSKIVFRGAIVGVLSFYFLFGVEDFLSHKRLYQTDAGPTFSQVTGHCGVYAARAFIHSYYMNLEPFLQNHLKDYKISTHCRARHFTELQERNLAPCAAGVDAVQCQITWMNAFAEKGFWNLDTRSVFLDRILDLWEQSKKSDSKEKINAESWMEYAIKDYDLMSATSNEMKQAGIDEQFSDEYLYFKQKDDVDNLRLTKKIFEKISTMVSSFDSQSPEMLKYRETERESAIQLEKLPELEKDLTELGKRINYNPSL